MDEELTELLAATQAVRPATPPPLPEGAAWADASRPAAERAAAVVAELSLEEKSSLLYGRGLRLDGEGRAWQAFVQGVDRLGIPDVTQADSPAAILVGPPNVSQLPSEHALGASFDPEVARAAARVLGAQARRLGYGVLHAPNLDVTRDPRHGRSHENFGEDVHLVATLGRAYAEGVQEAGVVADVKHFGMNTVEKDRRFTDYVVDERRLLGHYLATFRSVLANVPLAMVMTAYAKINGAYVNDTAALLDLLREEWGFGGIVRNDAYGIHSLESLTLGLDQEFRDEDKFGAVLLEAVAAGEVPESVVDRAVTRIITTMFAAGLVDDAPVPVEWTGPSETETATLADAAVRGVVLLENRDGVLPLDPAKPLRVAVFGPAAVDASIAGGPTRGIVGNDTVFGALREALPEAELTHTPGADPVLLTAMLPGFPDFPVSALGEPGDGAATGATGTIAAAYFDADGALLLHRSDRQLGLQARSWAMGSTADIQYPPEGTARVEWRGTWTADAGEYGLDIVCGGAVRVRVDGEEVLAHEGGGDPVARTEATLTLAAGAHAVELDYDLPEGTAQDFVEVAPAALKVGLALPAGASTPALAHAADVASAADVAIVVVRDLASEGVDRSSLRLPGQQDQLIEAIAAVSRRTVVVLATASAVLTPWRDRVSGLVQAWYGGSRGGEAVARVLSGGVDPGGRLPVSFPRSDEELPTFTPERFPGVDRVVRVDEPETGYRYFGAPGSPEAAYPFGYGLSYTEWSFDDLVVPTRVEVPAAAAASARRSEAIRVQVTVANTGSRAGRAVPQLYLRAPGSGAALLAAFASVELEAGESRVVTLEIAHADLARYGDDGWAVPAGEHAVTVGAFAGDDRLSAVMEVVVR